MLHDSKDMPKIQTVIDPKTIEKYGGTRMYFAPPIDYDKIMRRVPYGKVVTVGIIREHSCSGLQLALNKFCNQLVKFVRLAPLWKVARLFKPDKTLFRLESIVIAFYQIEGHMIIMMSFSKNHWNFVTQNRLEVHLHQLSPKAPEGL